MDTHDLLLQRVHAVVDGARHLGSRVLPNGTELVAHVPHVAPAAWLHVLFPALDNVQIASLETRLTRTLPTSYRCFLEQMNGIKLFSGSLTIYGLRTSYERTGDAVWQPFDVVDPNTIERPSGVGPNDFIVGGYNWDGSKLCVDVHTGETWRRTRDRPEPLNRWPSLLHMLASEAERLATHFDAEGKELDPQKPTTPLVESSTR